MILAVSMAWLNFEQPLPKIDMFGSFAADSKAGFDLAIPHLYRDLQANTLLLGWLALLNWFAVSF